MKPAASHSLTQASEHISPLHLAAQRQPRQAAYRLRGVAVSYASLSQTVLALSEQLRRAGLKFGDRLACIGENTPELMMLYWACIDTGVLFCPISPRFPATQVQRLITEYGHDACWCSSDVKSRWAACDWRLNTRLISPDFSRHSDKPPALVDSAAPANAILTSGSTGLPKAAVHSLKIHIASAMGARSLIPLAADDAWLLSLPLFHIGGLAILNRCALVGACVVFDDGELSLAERLVRDKITHLSLVATQLQRLLSHDADSLSHIKALLLGGGAIEAGLISTLRQRNVNAFTSYGMTEMASQITTGAASANASSGRLLANRELKIVDGVIYVRGQTLFLGYLKQDRLELPVDEDGWFCTKDLGGWDPDGNLCIRGRQDNMFICGGENLQPEEIEAALKQHPDIEDAIVFPLADEEFGQLPAAIIKGRRPDDAELEHFLADRIARFKRPRHYYSWPEIETTGLKVARKALVDRAVQTKS